jgi:methyltransferase (TIGR00027 family)
MFGSPRVISLRVPDIEEGKTWYRKTLNQEPIFDAPFAVVFSVGDCALILLPGDDSAHPDERCVAFFEVDDIEQAYDRLLGAGATPRSEITFTMLQSRTAKVADPFGSVIGITSTVEKAKSVESRPSESAMTVAFSRALAAHDDREGLHGPDYLAEVFLNEEGKRVLEDKAGREWIMKKMIGTHEYFLARTRYLDGIVENALRDDVPQLVLLGAGYDSRPYRFRDRIRSTRIFELDVEPTQQRKRALLQRAGVNIPEQLVYVTANFEKESFLDSLVRAGFDRRQKTLFVWEGVTYYLGAPSVNETLEAVRSQVGGGSAISFDYLIQAPDLVSRYAVKTVLEAWRTAYSGEPVRFGIDEGTIATFLSERGYRLVEHLGPEDLERRFLLRSDGTIAGRVVAMFGLVHALIAD